MVKLVLKVNGSKEQSSCAPEADMFTFPTVGEGSTTPHHRVAAAAAAALSLPGT